MRLEIKRDDLGRSIGSGRLQQVRLTPPRSPIPAESQVVCSS